jgi:hypothetical protein
VVATIHRHPPSISRAFTQVALPTCVEVHCWNQGFARNLANVGMSRWPKYRWALTGFAEVAGADFDELKRGFLHEPREPPLMTTSVR